MNQRERFLAITVGALLIALVAWSGIEKYQTAVKQRRSQITQLEQDKIKLTEQQKAGFVAERQMTEYQLRSLPSDVDKAKSDYQQWLLDLGLDNSIDGLIVDPTTTLPVGGLYQKLGFRFSGSGDMPNIVNLLYEFYSKDYLHRVRELTIRKSRTDDELTIEMSIDAMALVSAAEDAEPLEGRSWQIDGDLAAYADPILNRNLFEPPNKAPMFAGKDRIEAIIDRDTREPLVFRDPDNHRMQFDLIGEYPDFVSLDRSGTLRIRAGELTKFDLIVRATDNGYPKRSAEKKISVQIVPPPEPEKPPAPKLKFDESSLTVLTGLTHGRDDWTAWMHVRTRDEVFKLRVNEEFQVGSLKVKAVELTGDYVVFEDEDGTRFTLKPDGNLKEAADRAKVD